MVTAFMTIEYGDITKGASSKEALSSFSLIGITIFCVIY